MNELNFKPATGGSFAGDRTVAVPALDTNAALTGTLLYATVYFVIGFGRAYTSLAIGWMKKRLRSRSFWVPMTLARIFWIIYCGREALRIK